jgi:uncharacterized repeat protein (TIGR02543 family)
MLLYLSVIQGAHAQVSVDVWTNKGGRGQGNLDGGTYTVGEYIRICFSISANVDRLRFHIITPDGRDIVYYDDRINAGTYCLEGVEMGPVGVHRIIVEAWIGGNLVAADEVRYNVVGCPSHTLYLGLRITVKGDGSDELIVIEGWIRPEGISWDVFKSQCYNVLGPSYYHENYIRDLLVRPSLNAASLTEVGRGIDDSARIVWTRFRTWFSSLGYSDRELKILRIVDRFKGRGGFIDEVRVESSTKIWRATPTPTSRGENYVEWRNTKETAPDEYEIYLYPVATLRLRVEGVPQGRSLDVIIDGRNVGTISATQTFEKRMLGLEHELNVSPNILEGESTDVRYVCVNCPYHVVADESTGLAEISLAFKKEYRIIIDSEPRVAGLIIDGRKLHPSELPYDAWWLEGTQHSIKLLEREVFSSLSENTRKVYRFEAWSDGETREERIINVNSPITIKSIYSMQMQYMVTISTLYGTAVGICQNIKDSTLWCDEREVLQLRVDSDIVSISEGKRAKFTGWIIDGKLTSQSSVLVDSPKDIRAVWKIQYFVNVDKVLAEADVVGAGWYDEGDVARLTVKEARIYVSDDTRYVFDGWEGSCEGLDCGKKEITVTVSKPLSFRAKWYPEYRIKVAPMEASPTTDCPEWVKGGNVCMFNASPELPSKQSADTKYRFVKWVISSGGKTFREDTDTKITVGVDKPITATAYYEPWHRIIISGGPASPVISGCVLESNSAWCKEGILVTIDLPITSVGFLVTQEFKGWVVEVIGQESTFSENKSITLQIVGPTTIATRWALNYTPLIFISAAALSTSTLYLFIRKRGLRKKTRADFVLEKIKILEKTYRENKISEEVYKKLIREYKEELKKVKTGEKS